MTLPPLQTLPSTSRLAAGGNAVDMSKVTYTVSTPTKEATFTNSSVTYSWVQQNTRLIQARPQCRFVNPREMVLVTIAPGFLPADLGVNTEFIVQVNPPIGAALPIARTVPAGMTKDTWYEVY